MTSLKRTRLQKKDTYFLISNQPFDIEYAAERNYVLCPIYAKTKADVLLCPFPYLWTLFVYGPIRSSDLNNVSRSGHSGPERRTKSSDIIARH